MRRKGWESCKRIAGNSTPPFECVELNTKMVGAAASRIREAGGKRETGAKPVRSRHCEPESTPQNAIAKVRRRGAVMTRKSGNLPAIGTGQRPGHEELAVLNTAAFAAGLGYAMRPSPERSPFRIPTVGVPFFVGLTDDTLGRILFINFFCAKDTRRKKQ